MHLLTRWVPFTWPSVVSYGFPVHITCDVYLNEVAYWRNIPAKVWGCYIGGYQVIKKWLSYREKPLLGRPLTPEEIDEVTHMARRLAAIVLLEPALNGNYQSVKAHPYPWPRQQR